MAALARPGLTAIGVILAACATLALAMFATQFNTFAQTEIVARMEKYSQQIADLNKFGASLTAPDIELRAQASIARASFPQRFAQTMVQLDAAADSVARNYSDDDVLRSQFTRTYADLRGRYEAAHRSIGGDDAAGTRRSDYFVIHSDAITQSAKSVDTLVTQMVGDDLRRMLYVGRSLSASASTVVQIWTLAGFALLFIVGVYALNVYVGARRLGRLALAANAFPEMEPPVSAPAPREIRDGRRASDLAKAQAARPVVAGGAALVRAIDQAIPTALTQDLKTGVLHLAIMDIQELRERHSEAEIDALQNAVGASVSAALRVSDMVAKLGEGEFGILVEEIRQRSDFPIIEQRIRRAITFAKMRLPQFSEKDIQLRIGSAMYPIDGYTGEDLMLSARTVASMHATAGSASVPAPAAPKPAHSSNRNQPLDA